MDQFASPVEEQSMSDSIDDLNRKVAENEPTPKYIFDSEEELVDAINKKCQMISLGDETRFVIRNDKGVPRLLRRRDAETELAQYQFVYEVEKKDGTVKVESRAGFGIWLKSADRVKYEGQIFQPWYGSNEEPDPLYLNMWTGYAVEPKEGDWSLMRDHVRDNICNGNADHFNYMMAWLAQLFQHPEEKIGVAVVVRGKKGAGKSILAKWIRNIIGVRHAMVAGKKDQWTGRFTGQLRYRIFLACEEALFAGSHEQDSSIKHLITEDDFSYESKGKEIDSGPNFTCVMLLSNEDWAVPATPGERRFFVTDVSDTHVKDTAYFGAITKEMKNGGAAAMLYDLLRHDYSAIDLRNPPETDALRDQIETGLPANLAWLASALTEGQFPFHDRTRQPVAWPDKPTSATKDEALFVLKSDVQDSYRDFVPGRRDRPVTDSAVGKFLAKHIPGVEGIRKRVRAYDKGVGILTPHYRLPWLSDARAAFLKANPGMTLAAPDKVEDEMNTPEAEQECSSPVTPLAQYRRRARY
jgi:hypothetical protein